MFWSNSPGPMTVTITDANGIVLVDAAAVVSLTMNVDHAEYGASTKKYTIQALDLHKIDAKCHHAWKKHQGLKAIDPSYNGIIGQAYKECVHCGEKK